MYPTVDAVPGIVAKDTSTVILISKLLLQQDCLQTFDDSMLPIPWNEQVKHYFALPRIVVLKCYNLSWPIEAWKIYDIKVNDI